MGESCGGEAEKSLGGKGKSQAVSLRLSRSFQRLTESRTDKRRRRTSMAFNDFKKRRTPTAILAMLMALFTILFVASCSGGGTSSGGASTGGESASAPEESLPTEVRGVDDVADLNVLPDFKVGKTDSDNLGNDERKQLLENGIAAYKNKFAERGFADLIDPDGSKQNEICVRLEESDEKGTEESLYGETGLNGLYGVYQTTYRFYKNYLFVETGEEKTENGYININPDKLANYYVEEVKKQAKGYVEKKFTVGSDSDCTTECNGKKAVEFADSFRKNELLKITTANGVESDKVTDTKNAVNFYYEVFFESKKYEDETINPDGETAYEKVYGADGKVKALDELEKARQSIDDAFMKTAKSDYEADLLTKTVLNNYIQSVTGGENGLRTYMSVAKDNVNGFGQPKSGSEDDDAYIERLKGELVKIEEYLERFDGLETATIKNADGTESKIDLRSLKKVDDEAKKTSGDDWTSVSGITQKYASLTKSVIGEIKNKYRDNYDVTAEVAISDNVRAANAEADKLKGRYDKDGKVNAELNTGSVIADRFENTYKESGTLLDGTVSVYNLGKVTKITYDPSKEENKGNMFSEMLSKFFKRETLPKITLTAIDNDGNEKAFFDAKAKLKVREGATPSVERNINKIINDVVKEGETEKLSDKRISTAVVEEDREKIKKKSLYLYLTFTIMEPETSSGASDKAVNYIVIDEKKLEKFDGKFLVTLEFETDKVGKETNVKDLVSVGYDHGKITSVNENKNVEEGSKMASFILDKVAMSKGLSILNGDAYKDTAFFIAVGVLGVIVLIFLIWAIVAVVKRKKYKVRYDASGGKFGSSKRVKYCKNLVYPNNPTRKGYQFMGWYTNKKGTKRFDATDKMKRKCVKVYAKWMPVKKYEKVNDAKEKVSKKVKNNTERKNMGVAYGSYGTGVHQPLLGVEVDPRIQKLEVEKLSYEAKKAEEERRAEEVRLQTIREIEAAKGNEDAKANAEKDAEKAKLALQQALAEREALISLAKAEERSKVLEEMLAANNGEGLTSEDIEKIKKETEDRIRAEIEEENRRKETESLAARVKALEEANLVVDEERINALLDEKLKAYESAKAREEEIAAKLAEAEAKAEAEAEKAREAEEARLKAEAARAKAEEEANKAKAEEAARLALELEIKIAEEEARRKAAEEEAKLKAEEEARLKEEEEARLKAEEEAEKNRFKPEATFDKLKAEMLSFKEADDLGYGLGENAACSVKVADGAVVVEANLDKEDCLKKGYDVTDGDTLAVKMVVNSNDEIENAEDLIEDAAYENGYTKGEKAEATASDEETRANGYVLSADKRLAENVDEYYKLLRVYAKSFVLADGEANDDKPLIKMFKGGDKVYIYLNYAAENLNAASEEMQAEGYKSIMVVKTADECKEAIKAITAMMRENGLVRFPTASTLAEDNSDKGFTYTLRA